LLGRRRHRRHRRRRRRRLPFAATATAVSPALLLVVQEEGRDLAAAQEVEHLHAQRGRLRVNAAVFSLLPSFSEVEQVPAESRRQLRRGQVAVVATPPSGDAGALAVSQFIVVVRPHQVVNYRREEAGRQLRLPAAQRVAQRQHLVSTLKLRPLSWCRRRRGHGVRGEGRVVAPAALGSGVLEATRGHPGVAL
ncbi:unnamed protein product, partial [Ectocarpus sp. 13 AM-2016]